MFIKSLKFFIAVTTAVLFVGCQQQPRIEAPSTHANLDRLDLFVVPASRPVTITLGDHELSKVLTGRSATLSSSDVSLKYTRKNSRNDALALSWDDDWRATLAIAPDQPVNLNDYLAAGVLSLDINVLELAKGGVSFKLDCGTGCERRVPFTERASTMAGKGWKNIRFDMSCFVQDGDDFSAIKTPFIMETGGTGEVAIANVQFLKNGRGNAVCPDYKTVAVTPAKLNEYWARDWWEPRHQQNLARIQQGNVDLLMIGDSITEGWAKDGKSAWEKYYAQRNAVNLGYSGDRTENVLWRLQNGEVAGISPKVAVLMIGTNNTGHRMESPQYTAIGIKAILNELRTRLPETKILLLGVFPRAELPDAPMRKINAEINQIISGFADNQHIFFLDLSREFLDADGVLSKDVMPDFLHLNEASYTTWAEAMEPKLGELFGD